MRQIKFRAWDKKIKKMWWNVQNAYDGQENHQNPDKEDDNCDYSFYSCNFGDALKDDDYVVMQFTGLLDKNGKEIFEGDIIAYRNRKDELMTGIEVKWTGIMGEQGVYGYGYDITPDKCEIIGNIYENSELLK